MPAWDKDKAMVAAVARARGKGALVKKPRAKRAHPEQDLQIAVIDALKVLTIKPARFWFCPNGGNLSRAQAAAFQSMGLTPGVCDLHFAWSHQISRTQVVPAYGVIELKAKDGTERPGQIAFMDDMRAIGHDVAVCRSVAEVIARLREWGFPLRMATI